VSQDMLAKIFTSRAGESFTASFTRFGIVVGKLEAIHTGDSQAVAQMADNIRPQMTVAFFRELGEAAHIAARQQVKVTINTNLARQAIGLEPIDPKAADAKGKAPAKPGLAK